LIFTLSLIFIGTGSYVFAEMEYVDDPVVILETNLGNITIEFFALDAPNHRTNFIVLAKSGYYDQTLFHRIIPGFMIQGGDPNTISGSSTTWGLGGPDNKIDAEFNTIEHKRGIVSMARSADPNSAGSQFFIVHKDSNFLDGEYTVFGRIITDESYETLDKIAELKTTPDDKPINAYETRIIKATVVERSNIVDILQQGPPKRMGEAIPSSTGNQIFESQELDIKFSAPEGWLLQQPEDNNPNSPDVVAVGPKINGINPVISLTISDVGDKTIDELIKEKNNILDQAVYAGDLEILSQNKIKSNVYQTEAKAPFVVDEIIFTIKFLDVMILSNQKSYTFTYSNADENFNDNLSRFNESIDSFEILSQTSSVIESSEEGGGCLIATATYGSEMAPQVQQLREIRDNQLMNTELGSAFMSTFNDFYYSFSPIIADYERENPVFKKIVKAGLTPMLSTLSIMQSAETESEVLGLGLSVIALNIGMYLGLPAIVVIGINRKF
jgi:peptidyl-prolyl cis-trans isomerase B (cyclophilin B)